MTDAAWLVLEDGTVFAGRFVVRGRHDAGEVVFNTALTGYQEIMTDPSYAGQMVVLTYPLIGNYGTAPAWAEWIRPAARALLVHRAMPASHAQASWDLVQYCRRYDLTLVADLDTRALTRHLRERGTLRGVLTDAGSDREAAVQRAHSVSLAGIVDTVSTPRPYELPADGPRVAVIDYGVKQSILDRLRARGFALTVLPARTTAEDLEHLDPDGVVLSNGPGDPADLTDRLDVVRLAVERYPTLGICLGHQLVALALGGRTYPLKFGHHGSNHPVMDMRTGRVQITSHNHGYAVDRESLGPDLVVRFVNLHDQTVEGLEVKGRPVVTVQHHPEAGPGPHDADFVFDEFERAVAEGA
jgi:carbamoyl-phosphate synthase small subunit